MIIKYKESELKLLQSQVGEAVEIVTGDTNKSKEITEVLFFTSP